VCSLPSRSFLRLSITGPKRGQAVALANVEG